MPHLHRCYIDPGQWTTPDLSPGAEEDHRLLHVLRAELGDRVEVFDGSGRSGMCEVVSVDTASKSTGSRVVLRVLVEERAAPRAVDLVLIQAVPKGKRMDLIVEKATELGVATILPMVCERSVVRLGADAASERNERWRRIALGASRQCGTSWIPDVAPVRPYPEAIAALGDVDLLLVATLGEGVQPLRDVLQCEISCGALRRVGLVIGPEGDLTSEELATALGAGGVGVSFGSNVLRTETAAIFGLSVLAYEFRLWQGAPGLRASHIG